MDDRVVKGDSFYGFHSLKDNPQQTAIFSPKHGQLLRPKPSTIQAQLLTCKAPAAERVKEKIRVDKLPLTEG